MYIIALFTLIGWIYRSVVIQQSARKEFEDARGENDPEMILQLILGGRTALDEVKQRVSEQLLVLTEYYE